MLGVCWHDHFEWSKTLKTDDVSLQESRQILGYTYEIDPILRMEGTKQDRWTALKRAYQLMEPELLKCGRDWTHPYFLDFGKHFSPIESIVWSELRSNRVAMYPEYPVQGRFIDFWNPALRVGLEADGREWHDRVRDTSRDQEIWNAVGGVVFRVTGAECNSRTEPPWELDADHQDYSRDLERWWMHSSAGVVRAISVAYGGIPGAGKSEREWALSSLTAHCLLPNSAEIIGKQLSITLG